MLTGREYFYAYFAESVINIAKGAKVLDIGTTCKFRKGLAPFRKFFNNNYYALDYKPQLLFGEDNVDINGSIYQLPCKDNSIDAILCLSVFEHLCDPFRAAREVYRILKKNGKVFLTIPFMFAEHAKEGDYGDYFRFTEQGIRHVFKNFTKIEIVPQGRAVYYRLSMFPQLLRLFQNPFGMKIIKFLDLKTRSKTTISWMINLMK